MNPQLKVQTERLVEKLDDIKPLLPVHWEELALDQDKVPLDPQYDIYLAREARGELVYVTVRNEDDELVGYFIGFIAPGLHYKTCLTCNMDIFYILPEYRGKRAGEMLFQFVELHLKSRGVDRWFVGSKMHKDSSFLFKMLGFEQVETYYSKWIGD